MLQVLDPIKLHESNFQLGTHCMFHLAIEAPPTVPPPRRDGNVPVSLFVGTPAVLTSDQREPVMSVNRRFEDERASVLDNGIETRVDTNQRHLIDKILARYCTPNAVYRELLQNSNDAKATCAEIRFRTNILTHSPNEATPPRALVDEVVYRNNGVLFDEADWSRLTCIASGNPNPDHIGFFGVGSFTLFSTCDEPMVISGGHALVFRWKGDALFTKRASRPHVDDWTSFILPTREPAPVPDLVELGSFLAGSLTFTSSLCSVRVFVDDTEVLSIAKSLPDPPVVMSTPKTSAWWSLSRGPVLTTPTGVFTLTARDGSLTDTNLVVTAKVGSGSDDIAQISARIIAAHVTANVPPDMRKRMTRVTKKEPPKQFQVRIVLPHADEVADGSATTMHHEAQRSKSRTILDEFAPRMGAGHVYIGFRTSQTTGFACHLAVPLIPTVEREAIDLVDPVLHIWNKELLNISGTVMRLALEHGMSCVAQMWDAESDDRAKAEISRLERVSEQLGKSRGPTDSSVTNVPATVSAAKPALADSRVTAEVQKSTRSIFSGLTSFMSQAAGHVTRLGALVAPSFENNLLNPADPDPMSRAERNAVILMRSFEPHRSVPDNRVGLYIASGFEGCLSNLAPPILTRTGVIRGDSCFMPHMGIESFARSGLLRKIVLDSAEQYVRHVAKAKPASLQNLVEDLRERPLSEDEGVLFFMWFMQYCKRTPQDVEYVPLLKQNASVRLESPALSATLRLERFSTFVFPKTVPVDLPLHKSVLPAQFTSRIPSRVLRDASFNAWFAPLTWREWAIHLAQHEFLVGDQSEHSHDMRLRIFSEFAKEYSRTNSSPELSQWFRQTLGTKRCMPTEDGLLELPTESYLNSSELAMFSGANIRKVSKALLAAPHISKSFLVALGVREAVTLDVLFSALQDLKWTTNPSGLVRYLVAVQDKLARDEWMRLQETKFLPSAADQELHAPRELCLPSHELATMPFIHIIRWPGVLPPNGAEARLLSEKLGMLSVPSLETVLVNAADGALSSEIRRACILFAAARLNDRQGTYFKEFEGRRDLRTLKFIPAIRIDPFNGKRETGLQSPSDCYLESRASCLDFWIVQSEYEQTATAFLIERDPSGGDCSQSLLDLTGRIRTKSEVDDLRRLAIMNSIFDYMSTRVGSLGEHDVRRLRCAEIVPTTDAEMKLLVWRKPCDLYFKPTDSQSLAAVLFTVVNENVFLRAVGVTDEPSVSEITSQIILDPESVYSKMSSSKRYEDLLRLVASHLKTLPENVRRQLRDCKFLLATKLSSQDDEFAFSGSGDESHETAREQHIEYVLARARDIVLVDDTLLQRQFNPLCAPLDAGLEAFYEALGSRYISSEVERTYELSHNRDSGAAETSASLELSDRIFHRRVLILESASRPLSKNSRSLLDDTLRVREVKAIRVISTLRGVAKVQPVTCCAQVIEDSSRRSNYLCQKSNKSLILFMTPDVDFFDVASALGKIVYARCSLQDVFLLAQILETSLAQLRARGFPVDKLVVTTDRSTPNSRVAEGDVQGDSEPRPGDVSAENANLSLNQGGWPATTASVQDPNASRFLAILLSCFPDADPVWIADQVAADPTEKGMLRVKEQMERFGYKRDENTGASTSSTPPARGTDKTAELSSKERAPEHKPKLQKRSKLGFTRGFKVLTGSLNSAIGSHGPAESTFRRQSNLGKQRSQSGQLSRAFGAASDPSTDVPRRDLLVKSLETAIQACHPVPVDGISDPTDRTLPNDGDAEAADTCEIIPGHDLHPVQNSDGSYKTSHGIRVFASLLDNGQSAEFCLRHYDQVERFSCILKKLAEVFQLRIECIAIYYSANGRTIAFNANRSLHFNLRFYVTLHDQGEQFAAAQPYIYWFTTACHELAHNFATGHGKLHEHYMESFFAEYTPALIEMLKSQGLV